MMFFLKRICGAILLVIALSAQPVWADSRPPLTAKTYESTDRTLRFRVTPSTPSSQYEYFKETTEAGKAPAREKPAARGVLERRNMRAGWDVVWDRSLVNVIAPFNAIVSPAGKYVVTFDDWEAIGTSENTVAIYAADGGLIKVLALSDMVPEFYIAALSRTVSSVHWSTGAQFSADGEELVIHLAAPRAWEAETREEAVDLKIRLSDGKLQEKAPEAWNKAQAQALRINEADALARKKAREAFIAPLYGPTSASEPEWHDYLTEAFFRVDENWEEGYPETQLLRSPDAENYALTEQTLRERLLQKKYKINVLGIASLSSPEHFLKVLDAIMRDARKDSLKDARIYVAIPARYGASLATIFTASGARVVVLDPKQPIPQRPERIEAMEQAEREVEQ